MSIQPERCTQGSDNYERRLDYAIERTAQMFGCFRKGEANDPKMYTAGVAKTLVNFDEVVIEYVTSIDTGMPAKQDFLPTIHEVRVACEDRASFLQRQIEREEQARKQLAERVELPTATTYVPPPGSRLVDWREHKHHHGRPVGRFEKPGDKWNKGISAEQ